MSFVEIGYRPDKLVKLDIKINGEEAPPLAIIIHRDKAHEVGKLICNKLKELIPRQQFKVGVHVVCDETVNLLQKTRRSFHFIFHFSYIIHIT